MLIRASSSLMKSRLPITPKFSSLSKILAGEVSHELSQQTTEVDQEFLDIKKLIKKTFSIADTPGVGLVKLNRKFGEEEISIKFDCQNEVEIDHDIEEEVDEDEGDVEADYGINFEVIIEKQNQPIKLMIDCVAASKLEIRNIQIFPKDGDVTDLTFYGGPRYLYGLIIFFIF